MQILQGLSPEQLGSIQQHMRSGGHSAARRAQQDTRGARR